MAQLKFCTFPGGPMRRTANKQAVMNHIWFFLLASSVVYGAFNGKLGDLTAASFDAAKKAVELSIGLVGAMALWLGLVRIGEEAGLMEAIAKAIRPVMVRLFPNVPADHPAMSAMIMNMAANALGLGNAATPLGIKAMTLLQRLNPLKERATDAMCLFLAINTSNVTLLPLGVITVRAAAGAKDPSGILIPSLLATTVSTIVAIVAAKLFCWRQRSETESLAMSGEEEAPLDIPSGKGPVRGDEVGFTWRKGVVGMGTLLLFLSFSWQLYKGNVTSASIGNWLIPILIFAFAAYGFARGVEVYQCAVDGAKEGFEVGVRLIPFLVMILVAVAMFRESGAFSLLSAILSPFTSYMGVPAEVLPVALLRPLSGSGAFGLMSEITARAPDSYAAFLAGTIQGSTETTFYVMAVYFGAVGITNPRYAISAALLADLAGFIASVVFARLFF